MDDEVRRYVDQIAGEHWEPFDRVNGLIVGAPRDAAGISDGELLELVHAALGG